MAPLNHDVKDKIRLSPGLKLLIWVDSHPRTGWYFGGILLLNTVLNLIEVLK